MVAVSDNAGSACRRGKLHQCTEFNYPVECESAKGECEGCFSSSRLYKAVNIWVTD